MPRKRRPEADPTIAVAYVRASTDGQHLTPDAQRQEIEAWAERQGVTVAAWASDIGVSGTTPVDQRPGFLGALEALEAHGAGVLLVAKRCRLARDVVVAVVAEHLVCDRGARVVSVGGEANGEDPEAQLMRTIHDAFNAYERARIVARTKAALAVKKARGQRVGSVPFGHRLAADGVHLEHHPEEQATIARLHELRDEGLTIRAIAARLDEEGHRPRGKRWHPTTVARLLG